MKKGTLLLTAAAAALLLTMPMKAANAQSAQQADIEAGMANLAEPASGGISMDDPQFRDALAQAFINQNTGGSIAGSVDPDDGEEAEVKKTYRYNTRNSVFHGAELPKRAFNNIPYPY